MPTAAGKVKDGAEDSDLAMSWDWERRNNTGGWSSASNSDISALSTTLTSGSALLTQRTTKRHISINGMERLTTSKSENT